MDKKFAIFAVIVLVVVAFVGLMLNSLLQPAAQGEESQPLTISNFTFSESQSGPQNFTANVTGSKVFFEGPITKPTPCHGLAVSHAVVGNAVLVNINSTSYEGFCIQVIAEIFYKGSFEFSGELDEIIVSFAGQQIGRKAL